MRWPSGRSDLGDAPASGLVFVLSGPSGVGKDSVTRLLREQGFPLSFCVTATTRPPRPGEEDGRSYYFLSDQDFAALQERGELLEHAVVHGRQYGIPLFSLREGLRAGHDLLVTIDPQGAKTLRRVLPQAISIFMAPPSLEDLDTRLQNRGTETSEERMQRLETAQRELEQAHGYDYQIVNQRDRVWDSAETLKAIVTAERHRVRRRTVTL